VIYLPTTNSVHARNPAYQKMTQIKSATCGK
jgi:hypothetical protein